MGSYTKIVLVIFGASFGIAGYQTFGVEGLRVGPGSMGEMIGRTFGLAIVPLVFALPWNFVKRRKEPVTSLGAVVAGILVLIVISYYSTIGLKAQLNDPPLIKPAAYEYRAKNCDLAVTFPGPPKITPVKVVGSPIEAEQAELVYGEAYLRAECVGFPTPGMRTEEAVLTALENYARANGLENATVTTDHDGISTSAKVRGTKELSGIPTTYEIRMIATERSNLSILTGGVASGYPQAGIVEFQHSVHPAVSQ